MEDNPFKPPAHDDGATTDLYWLKKIDAGRAAALKARIDRLENTALLLIPFGLLLNLCGASLVPYAPVWAILAFWLGQAFWILGLAFHAKTRGRSWLWGICGAMGCIGYFGLALLLGRRCHHCRRETAARVCGHCGAPAPP